MYNHKVVPYRDVDVMGQFWDTNEAEEVVIGPIKGVDKYLVSVIVNPEWIRELVSDLKDPKESSEMYYFFREMFGMKNEMIDLSVRTLANYPINKVVPRGVPSLDMIPPNAVDKFA